MNSTNKSNTYRHVDKIEEYKDLPSISSKIEIWERAWLACAKVLCMTDGVSIKEYHNLIEKWIPILNKIHNYPIQKLSEYTPIFIYCEKANAPKEIISIYFDINNSDLNMPIYIIFNVVLFRKLHNIYITSNVKNNQVNCDLDRGVINLSNNNFLNMHPAEYFRLSSAWYLLFIAVNHALAHIYSFEKYDTASYSDHTYVKKSTFYKMYLYGRIKHSMI